MNSSDTRPKTIFCDIDGTLVKHFPPTLTQLPDHKMQILDGTIDKINQWDRLGYNIILVTGRKECMRKVTEKQLSEVGIIYDQLIMGIGGGTRVLINDKKPHLDETALSFCLDRDRGIGDLEI